MSKHKQKKTGFTIIEVSLVLGIAGLIFLAVFLALPSLQRSARDSERKEDLATFLRKVKDYQTNNRGALPKGTGIVNIGGGSDNEAAGWEQFYKDFMGEEFADPNGNISYTLNVVNCGNSVSADSPCTNPEPEDFQIVVVLQATCGYNDAAGKNIAVRSANSRKIAALYQLEAGQVYCANS